MHFTLGNLLIGDGSSFAFASGEDLAKTLVTADRPTASLAVSMLRSADNNQTVGSGTLQTLYAGEPYTLTFTVGPLSADAFTGTTIQQAMNYYQNTTEIQIVLPPSLKSQIDWSQSTCESTSGARDLLVKLNDPPVVIHDYGFPATGQGLHDIQVNNSAHPCQLEFTLTGPNYDDLPTTVDQASFTLLPSPLYAPNYNNTISYNASQDYNWQGLKRQDVQATFTPNFFSTSGTPSSNTGIIGSPSLAISMSISGASGVTGSALLPFSKNAPATYANQVDYAYPSCGTPVITDGIILNTTSATEVLHYPSGCSGQISMTYLGNAWFKPITGLANMTFNNAPATTTSITSPATGATSTYPSSPSFTAHVSSASGNPTGTVQFNDGANPIGLPVNLNGSGDATLASTHLSSGVHSITASFISDQPLNFGNSVSPAISVTINTAATTTVLTSNPTSWTANGSVAFSATVNAVDGSAGTPTGSVDFVDSGSGSNVILNTATVNIGVATFNTSLGSGNHSITAKFHATGNFSDSTSSPALIQNLSLPLTINLNSQSSYAFGQAETFTATFSSTSPAPDGTVTFWQQNGGSAVSFGSVAASTAVNGVITFQPVTSLPYSATHYSVYATFTPTSGSPYNVTTSNTLSIAITKVQTSITLQAPPSTINWGDQVTFNANVTGPNGTAQLYDGSSTLGSSFTITSGSGSFTTTTPLDPGTHNITAQFTPTDTANYANSTTPSSVSVTVNKVATTIHLTASAVTTNYGDTITFTATTTPSSLAGSLQIKDNNVNFGSAVTVTGAGLSTSTDIANLTASNLPHSVTAVFTPTDTTHYATSISNTLTQMVNKAPTSITITPSGNPNTYGTLTYTISVTAASTATTLTGGVAGTASFTYDNNPFNNTSVIGSGGAGTFFAGGLAVPGSPHTIVATFTPTNPNLAVSTSAGVNQFVTVLTTTITVQSSDLSASYGDNLTFTATPSTGTSQAGSVDFTIDGVVHTVQLNLVNGTAQYSTNLLTLGNHSIFAVFNPTNAPSVSGSTSSSISQAVAAISTSVGTISISPTSPKKTTNFNLSVTVSDSNGTLPPYGTVVFYYDNPVNVLGSVHVTSGSGSSLSYPLLNSQIATASNYTIYAVFTPDDIVNFNGSQNTLGITIVP